MTAASRAVLRFIKKKLVLHCRDTDNEPTIDESRPIPVTIDGYLYYCLFVSSGEHLSVDEVKAWADAQPWGPVKWD
jgi:hypothetical protein